MGPVDREEPGLDERREPGLAQRFDGIGAGDRRELRALDALGLEVDAEFDAVRVAWRKLAKENHPDVKPGDADAAERFRQIQAAYDVLRAAEERRLAL